MGRRGQAGFGGAMSRKRMCEENEIDDTKLVSAMNGKGPLDADTLAKLAAVGVNVKGLG